MIFEFAFGLMHQVGAGGSAPPWTVNSILHADFTRNQYFLAKYQDRVLSADFTNNTYYLKGGAS